MRFVRRLLRRQKPRPQAKPLTEQERIFKHIWRHIAFAGDPEFPPRPDRRDVLIVQMGKVASIALKTRSFYPSDLGVAFQRELRESEYGRACGYDRLSAASTA